MTAYTQNQPRRRNAALECAAARTSATCSSGAIAGPARRSPVAPPLR